MVFCGGGGGGGGWLGSCRLFVSRRAAGWAELWVVRGGDKGFVSWIVGSHRGRCSFPVAR